MRSLSFIVRINFSILPFPLWSLIGHSTCSMYLFLQKSLIILLRKIVAGSVLIFCGIPCRAIYFFRNSITFSEFGFRKNFASGHGVKWSIDTNKYFFAPIAFWKGPAKSIAISWFASVHFGSSSTCFCFKMVLMFLPAVWHWGHNLAIPTTSRCRRGHQTLTSLITYYTGRDVHNAGF